MRQGFEHLPSACSAADGEQMPICLRPAFGKWARVGPADRPTGTAARPSLAETPAEGLKVLRFTCPTPSCWRAAGFHLASQRMRPTRTFSRQPGRPGSWPRGIQRQGIEAPGISAGRSFSSVHTNRHPLHVLCRSSPTCPWERLPGSSMQSVRRRPVRSRPPRSPGQHP